MTADELSAANAIGTSNLLMAAQAGVAGALSMSIMQILKDLLPIMRWFLAGRFRAWMQGELDKLGEANGWLGALR